MKVWEAINVASTLTDDGDVDCVSCANLCRMVKWLILKLNEACPDAADNCFDPTDTTSTTNSPCGC